MLDDRWTVRDMRAQVLVTYEGWLREGRLHAVPVRELGEPVKVAVRFGDDSELRVLIEGLAEQMVSEMRRGVNPADWTLTRIDYPLERVISMRWVPLV